MKSLRSKVLVRLQYQAILQGAGFSARPVPLVPGASQRCIAPVRLFITSIRRCDDKKSTHLAFESTSKLAVKAVQEDEEFEIEDGLTKEGSSERIPNAYKVVLAAALSFMIGNMDKINISVAIIPMAKEFGWSPTVIGLVQSSFFWGYVLSQLPGGYASSRFGGRKVLATGVGLWSLATAMIPLVAGTVPGLCFARASVGLGEGLAPSAATSLIGRSMPPQYRSSATSFVFGGLHVGSLLGLILAPALIEYWDWQSVFYIFGGAGLLWNLWFQSIMGEIAEQDPDLFNSIERDDHTSDEEDDNISLGAGLPWRAFFRSRPLLALAFVHFTNNWFHYTMLAWLPTYFTDTMSLSLSSAAKISLLPPIAAIVVSAIAGPMADGLISRGIKVGVVRKSAQSAAFLGPALCLTVASNVDSAAMLIALISLSLGLASFSLAGLYCNHADLSPKYAPLLLGATNTAGAIPGIVGVIFTGYLYERTESWSVALFGPSIALFLLGTATFILYGTSEQQDFDRKVSNKEFAWERWVQERIPFAKKVE